MPSFETAARSLKVELITAPVHSDVEIETAIIALGREPGGGLVVVEYHGGTEAKLDVFGEFEGGNPNHCLTLKKGDTRRDSHNPADDTAM
jgi:hypothetical protein